MTRFTPPGADRRFHYVSYFALSVEDKHRVNQWYPMGHEHLPDCEYMYPVRWKDKRLADARRWMSTQRAEELLQEFLVQKIMER